MHFGNRIVVGTFYNKWTVFGLFFEITNPFLVEATKLKQLTTEKRESKEKVEKNILR